MAAITASDVTYTKVTPGRINKRRHNIYDISFGDGALTYPSTGVPLTIANLGMKRQLDSMNIVPQQSNIAWSFDATNTSLRATVPTDMPFLVIEESVATDGTGVLAWKPAYFLAIEGDDGSLFDVVPNDITPAANQVAVTWTTGAMSFGTGPSSTAKVTYVPLQASGLFSSNGLVVEETQTAASSAITLDNRAAAIQSVWNPNTATVLNPVPDGESPGAGECNIDINSSGSSVINLPASMDGDVLTVSYLKHSELGGGVGTFGFVDTTQYNLTSEVYDFNTTAAYRSLVLPGFGTRLVGEESGGANHNPRISGPGDTAANGISVWDFAKNRITTADTTAMTNIQVPLLIADPAWLYNQANRELHVTEAPAAQSLRVEAIGW